MIMRNKSLFMMICSS